MSELSNSLLEDYMNSTASKECNVKSEKMVINVALGMSTSDNGVSMSETTGFSTKKFNLQQVENSKISCSSFFTVLQTMQLQRIKSFVISLDSHSRN